MENGNLKAEKGAERTSIITAILEALRQKILLIVIIMIVAVLVGFAYNKLRKPDYTVYERAIFSAKSTAEVDSSGKIRETSAAHINAARKFISTVTDFFNTGIVSERAEYYYTQFDAFMNVKGIGGEDRFDHIDKFINSIEKKKLTLRAIEDCKDCLFDVKVGENETEFRCSLKEMQEDKFGNVSGCVFTLENGEDLSVDFNSTDDVYITLSDYVIDNAFFDGIKSGKVDKTVCYFDVQKKSTPDELATNLRYLRDDGENRVFKNSKKEEVIIAKDDIKYVVFTDYENNFIENSFNSGSENLQIIQENIGATYEEETDSLVITASYRDFDSLSAREKVKFVLLGVNREAKSEKVKSETDMKDYKYFNVVGVYLTDIGQESIKVNISNKKILAFFGLGGLAVALLTVYILSFFDKTVKTKEELEKLTGTQLLACLEKAKEEGDK